MPDFRNQPPTADELLAQVFQPMYQLFHEREMSKILSLLTDLGRTLSYAQQCSFWCWDKRAHQLWTLAAHDVNKIVMPEHAGVVGYAVQKHETLILNDPEHDPRFQPEFDQKHGDPVRSMLVLPVTNANGTVIGAYLAVNRLYGEPFSEADAKRLSLAAVLLGKLLASQLLYNAALEDQLTGLRNRRGFFEFFERAISPHMSNHPNCVIMGDIDFFKRCNDTYGHSAGDAVLRHVADVFVREARVDDGVFRWGGEEFMFLLPKTDLPSACICAERMRRSIEDATCEFEDQKLRLTMSFGVHQFHPAMSMDENLKAVDAKLYQAKENGRNCVQK